MLFKPQADHSPEQAEDAAPQVAGRRKRGGIVSTTLVLIILAGLGYVVWTSFNRPPSQNAMPRNLPVPVLAATPQTKDVPVYLEGVGTIRALNTVTVRAQVEGKLISVKFKEGQDVERGDVLAEIDPAIYRAQLDQALAKKAQDEATLANAKLDLVRYQQLALTNAGSRQQADTQRAMVAQLEALVRSDQAAIDNAQTMLDYTKIVAPISGRTGLRLVDQGNIIKPGDTNGLVIITQVKPIAAQFSLPQQQLPLVNAAFEKAPLQVDVFGNDGRTVVETGTLEGIDNQVDQTTGTVRLKAQFPNARLSLWPGQFVNVRVKVDTLSQAIVVPTSSVQRGPAGTYAFVIGPGDAVTAKPITVVQQTDTEAVIGSGLSTSDRVVTTGFANLAEGSQVVVGTDDAAPTPDLAPRLRKGQGPKGPSGGQKGPSGAQKGPGANQGAQSPPAPPVAGGAPSK
ncbi:efflux RND transporter periplasmic adaptor subunit [Bradyrhizobium sp. LHD-71]|uniref:efflux RND transporter periplasmic adaptor subunit n=1 Tax=Bradyrhizobium sp. LHD-71 TaxID=3072141 RepID=UPI00280E84B6|nr:efflux RND transporter periplasmic adaptor subunit [Bradyrhizobium sp. LHD-71]MDQ8730109.1 efflux RND transporter periplasmic adaptor subunit [Bradyrhizobium sp. LHD-71]